MKAFVDTNILVDFVCKRKEFLPDAMLLFGAGVEGKIQLVVSALSLVNAVYISRTYKLPVQEVKTTLLEIVSFTEVVSLTDEAALWALRCDWSDCEDATQFRMALFAGADCIVTRDKKGFAKSSLPVYSVAELMERIEAEGE